MSLEKKKGELCVGGALGDEAGGNGKSVGNGGSKCRWREFYCALLDWGGHSGPSPISLWARGRIPPLFLLKSALHLCLALTNECVSLLGRSFQASCDSPCPFPPAFLTVGACARMGPKSPPHTGPHDGPQ